MAITKVGTRGNKQSGWLVRELWPDSGFCRKTATVTFEAGMDEGSVLRLSAGKWVWVDQASVATLPADVAVLMDSDELDIRNTPAGDRQMVIMYQGSAELADKGLLFKNALSGAEKTTVYSKFEGKNFRVRTAV